jgi:hypothetical protein
MPTAAENYLYDVLPQLLERARQARAEAPRNSADEFAAGRAMAYYEVLSYLLSELESFGIQRSAVRIDPELDVDRDFL